jgi:hypothetical protein
MTNFDSKENRKNLMSRRALLTNGMLTGIGLAIGLAVTGALALPRAADGLSENKDWKEKENSNAAPENDSFIDNFDC